RRSRIWAPVSVHVRVNQWALRLVRDGVLPPLIDDGVPVGVTLSAHQLASGVEVPGVELPTEGRGALLLLEGTAFKGGDLIHATVAVVVALPAPHLPGGVAIHPSIDLAVEVQIHRAADLLAAAAHHADIRPAVAVHVDLLGRRALD